MPRYKPGSRKASSWVQALKIFNRQHNGIWVVPRKGSTEYNQVKEIQKSFDKKSNTGFVMQPMPRGKPKPRRRPARISQLN